MCLIRFHGGMFMKKCVRSALALTLAAAMVFPLTACKKKKAGKQTVVKEDDPYFTATKFPLKLEIDSTKKLEYQDMYNPIMLGDTIIASYNIVYQIPKDVEKKIDELTQKDQCFDYDKYASLMEGYYESGQVLFDINDGHVIEKIPATLSEESSSMYPRKSGGYYKVVTSYEGKACESTIKLQACDSTGKVEKEFKMPDEFENSWNTKILEVDDSKFIVSASNGICVLTADGKTIGFDKESDLTGELYSFDGKYYAMIEEYDEKSWESANYLREIDVDTGKFKGERIKTKSNLWGLFQGGDACYLSDETGIVKINPITGEKEMFMDWNWTDIANPYISQGARIESDKDIMYVDSEYKEDEKGEGYTEYSLVKLHREEKNPHAGKTIIEMGAFYSKDGKFRDYVISYNTDPNNKCRIIMKIYGSDIEWGPDMDYTKVMAEISDKVYLEMLAGEGPDILLDFSSYSQFNSDEVLLDLNTLIDGDSGLNRNEMFDNIFRAFEARGKLYHVPVCFSMYGLLSTKDIVGDKTGLTYEEFESIISSLPKDTSVFDYDMTYMALLEQLIAPAMNHFVDYEKKSVSFDSPEFRKALELAKKYGTEEAQESMVGLTGTDYEYIDPNDRLANGMLAFASASVYDLDTFARTAQVLKGKEAYLGIPSPDATGMSASPMLTLAISQQSKNKEAAWDFIRYMFTQEAQYAYAHESGYIPLNRAAFDQNNQESIKEFKEYNKMFEGVSEEDSVDLSKFGRYPEVTPEMLDSFKKLVESVSTIESTDPGILMIIEEEAPGFFSGSRSAEDVCKNIQNRATTKVHER